MRTDKIIKIVALNMGMAVLNIVIFSDGLMDIQLKGTSAFETAFGLTIILMSIVVFVFGNYKLLINKPKIMQAIDINTAEDCMNALRMSQVKKTFSKDIETILEQTERFQQKKDAIEEFLLQKFNSGEMSFSKFEGVITDIEKVFYINVKSILNKINAFDEVDYNRIKTKNTQKKFSEEFIQTKMSIYNEYFRFVDESIEDSEQILLKLDKLLLELSKFSSLEDGELENMGAMKEIDELINKTKFYK